jgi:hypothetical protein
VAHGDLRWSAREAARFFAERVVVVEKKDGINVTFMRGRQGRVEFAVKAAWAGALGGALVRSIHAFTRQRERALWSLVEDGTHFYAEWLWHRVSVAYDALPDVLVGIALADARGRILAASDADARIRAAGFVSNLPLFVGVLGDVARIRTIARASALGAARMEGVVVSIADDDRPHTRWAKWVAPWYRAPRAGALSGARNRLVE